MNRYVKTTLWSLLAFSLLPVMTQAQFIIEETASDFVNFNLNGINRVRSYYPEFNGLGQTVSIKEFQYDTLDIDFSGRHISHPISAGETSSHSTLMATIIAGGGNSFITGRGAAWASKLTSSSFLNIFPDPNSYFRELGISVQNHSYGIDSIENFYGPLASAYDLQANQLPELLHVFSVGNLGNTSPQTGPYRGLQGYGTITGEFKLAKNILTVGVVDSAGIIDPLCSHGPTFDGRIKPEIVAFGVEGASAAAALTSGATLLLQQAYREERMTLPPAALVKALLINGARDLGPRGVDHVYGFGNMDIHRSLETLLAGHYISDTIAVDQSRQHPIQVPEGVTRLKVTLVWNDPPAAIQTEKPLVNDLDLKLIRTTDMQQWLPQVLNTSPDPDSLTLPAINGQDHTNNIEQVVLDNPTAGAYLIQVNAFDFQVATQTYQLVYEWETSRDFRWLFPTKDNQVVYNKNFSERLYWEIPENFSQTGSLSYSFDGESWTNIATEASLREGSIPWSPPDTVARALLRMRIAETDYVSDTFTISSRPALQVVLNCEDSTGISWAPQPGIDQYQLYRLSDSYMEPFLLTSDTFVTLPKREHPRDYIAIAPVIPGGGEGVRSLAYDIRQQGTGCYFRNFYGEILDASIGLYLELSTDYNVELLTLEKLENGQFSALSDIPMPRGTQFNFTDPDPVPGLNNYRIGIRLTNGELLYSQAISLNFILPNQFKIYPNPLSRQGNLQVLYNVREPEQVRFQLYTPLGAQVFSLSLPELESTLYADDFQSGLYFYQFTKDGQVLQSGTLVVR